MDVAGSLVRCLYPQCSSALSGLCDRSPEESGTGGGVKTCFPEELPPGGGSLGQKEEQAGRETEVSAVDLRSLQSQYSDVRGWLTIPESGIDYPVLQSSPEEPEYYLRRDYRGNYDINGSLFLQADCILGESGKLTIYGHNMNSGAMFGNLDQYASYEYWKAHPSVFFQTPEGMEEYQIAAVLKADVSMFDFQQISFQNQREAEAYVEQDKRIGAVRDWGRWYRL